MIKTYKKGRNWEYKVRDFFTRKGCLVRRSAKSDFPDLVVMVPKGTNILVDYTNPAFQLALLGTVLIECKTTGRLRSDEIKQLQQFEKKYDVKCLLAYPKHGSSSKREDNINLSDLDMLA